MACQLLAQGELVEATLLIDTYHPALSLALEKFFTIEYMEQELKNYMITVGIDPTSFMGVALKNIYESSDSLMLKYKPRPYVVIYIS